MNCYGLQIVLDLAKEVTSVCNMSPSFFFSSLFSAKTKMFQAHRVHILTLGLETALSLSGFGSFNGEWCLVTKS